MLLSHVPTPTAASLNATGHPNPPPLDSATGDAVSWK
jgi:hypothetical protein